MTLLYALMWTIGIAGGIVVAGFLALVVWAVVDNAYRPLWQDLPEAEQYVVGSTEWFRYEGGLREYVEALAA